jgi:glycosyltransferase involved in cell wall biosynthesis
VQTGSVHAGPELTVAQLLPALEGGGVERGTLEVAAELVRRDCRSIVLSDGGRLLPELLASGSGHVCRPLGRKSPAVLRQVRPLRRFLAEQRVDILHARSRLPAWIGWLALRGMAPLSRPHFVTTVHGLYSVSAYSAVMTRGERVIAVSRHARDYILANYPGVPAGRIVVIPRGIDPAAFPAGYRPGDSWLDGWYRQYPQTRDRFVVTLAGRPTRRKGVLDFIGIIGRLRSLGVPAHGLLVGDIPKRREAGTRRRINAALAAAGARDAVTLTGFRSDLREIMALSGAVLSLSLHPESYGRTVSEALALGRPVAGYAHGGVGEQLSGLFPEGNVAVGDTAGMAAKLAGWYREPPSLENVSPWPLQRTLDDTLRVYRELARDP